MRDFAEIKSILKNFYDISGFRVSIHDVDLNEICSYPEHLTEFCTAVQSNSKYRAVCLGNDKKAFQKVKETGQVYIYKCQCGLVEAVSPIYHFGTLTGYLMIGQVCERNPETYERLFKLNRDKFSDDETARRFISSIPSVPEDKIHAYIRIMTVISEYITYTNAIISYEENLAPIIKDYIDLNYNKKFSLDTMRDRFGCCKSTMINCFKREYKKTIVEYVTKVRMEHAAEMLKHSNKSIKEIAADCGISNQNYFSKMFSTYFGCSPSSYRR